MFQRTTTTGSNVIEFSYSLQEIFNDASRASSFNAKNIRDKEGNRLLEDYSISDDETDIFRQGVTSILPDIYEKMLKMTSSIENAYSFEGDTLKFIIKDNDAYNANVLTLVDTSLRECLVEGSLMAWYKNCAHGDLLAMYTQSFQGCLAKLFDRVFQLKLKKSVSMLGEVS